MIEDIKKLREETGAGVMDAKRALEETKGDYEKAKKILVEKGLAKAAKKQAERTVKDGLVHSYVHANGKAGSLVLVACETDFVAKTDTFQKLCHEVAMQVCALDYQNVAELLEDDFMKDPTRKVKDIVAEAIAKLGEKIEIISFSKLSLEDM
jgi:elongation factor Ts